jgi:hypothetical protein
VPIVVTASRSRGTRQTVSKGQRTE